MTVHRVGRLVLLLSFLALAAGCIGADDTGPSGIEDTNNPGSAGAAEEDGSGETVEVHLWNGTMTGGVANFFGIHDSPDNVRPEIPVSVNATRIEVQLEWTGEGELDAVLVSPRWCEEDQDPLPEHLGPARCQTTTHWTKASEEGRFQNTTGNPANHEYESRLTVDRPAIERWGQCDDPTQAEGEETCPWGAHLWYDAVVEVEYTYEVRIHKPDAS